LKNCLNQKRKHSIDFCFLDIENNSTANANNPAKEPAFNSIEEKKQESLANDDPSGVGMY
jgi:hypothetical protein